MQDDDDFETTRAARSDQGEDAEVTFGDYAVIGTDIQIVLGGRLIAHPGD